MTVAQTENTAIDGTNSIRKELLDVSEDHFLKKLKKKKRQFSTFMKVSLFIKTKSKKYEDEGSIKYVLWHRITPALS